MKTIKHYLPLFLTSLSLHTYKRWRSGNGQKENEIKMKEKMKLLMKKNVTVPGNFNPVICSMEIYERHDRRKVVILAPPEGIEEYYGGSTTNFYERLATSIKSNYLAKIPNRHIYWVDHLVYKTPMASVPMRELNVNMSFDGKKYSNPKWGGRHHERLF